MLSVAVAAGHLVQTLHPGVPAGTGSNVAYADPAATVIGASGTGFPRLTGITSVAAATEVPLADGCDVALALFALPAALIDMTLSAPCNRGERVVIRHSGLSFTALTSPQGQLRLQIPAMEADALIAAYFDGSEMALSRVMVPEAASYVRVGIQIAFPAQFDLRAEEGGQVFVGSSGGLAEGQHRRIIPLGTGKVTQPLLAQIYTLPAAPGLADLTVEVRITPETCGRSLPIDTVLARNGKVTKSRILATVPPCGTSGDILLLKNLLPDLTLAAR